MIRRPPRSTLSSSSAASDVHKRQVPACPAAMLRAAFRSACAVWPQDRQPKRAWLSRDSAAVSYTHLRAHETPEHLVCRLLLEKKKKTHKDRITNYTVT